MWSEYIIEDFSNINGLKEKYPDIIFRKVSEQIYVVEVPTTAKVEMLELAEHLRYVQTSFLYGLNIEEALQDSGISVFHDYPYGELRGKGVILGFVDTGIEYTSNFFRFEDGSTRIVSIWDQTIEDGKPPKEDSFGSEYTREEINEALKSDNPLSIVPSTDYNGHGTYIAGVAGGSDRLGRSGYVGAAPDAEFIVVKMREASQSLKDYYLVKPGVVAYPDGSILLGINYIIEKAAQLNKPLVLCIAVGNNYGGHDGTNVIERYLGHLTLMPKVIVVAAAGNEGNAGHHYKNTVEQNEKRTVELNVAANENGFLLHIWGTQIDKLSVGLRSPIGQIIERVPLKPYKAEKFNFSLQSSKIIIDYKYPESNTGGESIVIAFQEPIAGIWQIDIYGDDITNGTFHMWLPRAGFVENNTRFSEPNLETTVCVPATADFVIVVGGYDVVDKSLYAASGRGPTRFGDIKPDIIAPSINIDGPGLNNTLTSATGTSVGAAMTAGAGALLLEWAILNEGLPTLNTRIARMVLARGAQRQPPGGHPTNIEGFGMLDLQNALLLI
ncbi:MAG: hypothetical protein BEN18_08550 [Epulopiscium sp. Nuni2H_MBin001]|nr:MAG: hypothetical protein BEN18_08550 [Epulopiscium sp. Nuni2H_MBin001]